MNDNPPPTVTISRIRTQVAHTSDGWQFCEAYRVKWTDHTSGTTIVQMVGDRKSALRLKRQLKGLS
jgi:hypothetical protein